MKDYVFAIGVVFFVGLAILVTFLIRANGDGVQYENTRLYKKCLVEKQEMAYNKAVEYCKERVK